MLESEGKRVEGHVELIKAEIFKASSEKNTKFARQVRDIAGSTKVKVWEDIEDTFKHSSKLRTVSPKRLDIPHPVAIPDHSQLLRRKTTKAEHGYDIAEDVRRLLEGCKRLKHI